MLVGSLRRIARVHGLPVAHGRFCSATAAPHGTATAAVHADALHEDAGTMFSTAQDVSPPLSLSTTYDCPEPGAAGHVYNRISSPTRERCEALLGAIEGTPDHAAHAVLYSSGLAATFGALSRLLPARVAISGGYHGTHLVLDQLCRISGGARCQSVPLPSPDDISTSSLQPGDAIFLETPRNPDCKVADIAAYVAAARSIGGVHVIVDGTFAPPPLQRPLTLGADVVMHSTTKSLAGHSDAVGGALCVSDASLASVLRADRTATGSTPGSLEPWLLMRSLRTLHLRVERQSATAATLAAWLHRAACREPGHPLAGHVHSVQHPSLPSDPSHEVAARQMQGGFGGCFALELSTEAAARALPAALTLFRDATSLGGVESLIEWRRKYDDAISPLLLRCSVGLEDADHLRSDLERAILKVSSPSP
jgi:cystathionine gamma-synthase